MFRFLAPKLGIDLGTANTLVYAGGQGIVLREPSVITLDAITKAPIAFGRSASAMIGRAAARNHVVQPLRDGVVTDLEAAWQFLQYILKQTRTSPIAPRIIIGVPGGATSVERQAIKNITEHSSVQEIELIDEPMAAAIGAGLPVTEAVGSCIVDIGGGTTEIAVVSALETVVSQSIRIAGDVLDERILRAIRAEHGLQIGPLTARTIKHEIGSAYPAADDDREMEVRGVDVVTGLPRSFSLKSGEVRQYLAAPLTKMMQAIQQVLEQTPPELAGDVLGRGLILTGGGALLKGIDLYFSHGLGLMIHISENPLDSVVLGTAAVMEQQQQFSAVLRRND